MAQPGFNAGKFFIAIATLVAVGLIAAFVLNQLQARGLV
jgi:hypothetical protein